MNREKIDPAATADFLQDELAVSLARAVAAANWCASDAGVDRGDSLISISHEFSGRSLVWRINYGPRDYLGTRGGDLLVEVVARDGSVAGILMGQ